MPKTVSHIHTTSYQSILLKPDYTKYIFVTLNSDDSSEDTDPVTDPKLEAIRETFEMASKYSIPSPIKEFFEISDDFANSIATYLVCKDAPENNRYIKARSRVHTDNDRQVQVLLLTQDEYLAILDKYMTSLKDTMAVLSSQYKELMSEYVSISSMSKEARDIDKKLKELYQD